MRQIDFTLVYPQAEVEIQQKMDQAVHQATLNVRCTLFKDNSGALDIARTPKMRPRTKHINIIYHHFQEYVCCHLIHIEFVSTQQDQVALVLLASFGAERPSAYQIKAETAPQFNTKAMVLPKQGPAPEFTRHFDYQIQQGNAPFSGGKSRTLGGQIRLRGEAQSQVGVPELLALVDAWPPVSLTLLNQPAPASSLTWTIEFIAHDLPFSNTDWWRYLAEIEYGSDGYHHIAAKLWQPDGKLAAISRQTVTVFA